MPDNPGGVLGLLFVWVRVFVTMYTCAMARRTRWDVGHAVRPEK